MENKNQSTTKVSKIIIGCTALLMLLASAFSILGLLSGSVVLSNTLLPANIFLYTGWMCYVFGVFGIVGFVFGIFVAFHGLTTSDVKSYKVSDGNVTRTSDGCMAQIMGVFLTPCIMAALAYAISYYLFWGVLEVGAFVLPYLIGLLLIVGVFVYAIMGWKRKETLSVRFQSILAGVILVIYGGLTFLFTSGVSLNDGIKVVEDVTASHETLLPKVLPKSFVLTKRGVGSLVLGKPFKNMSNSDEGLYNRVEEDSYFDEPSGCNIYTYTLYWDNTQIAYFQTVNNKDESIRQLTIYSPYVSLSNGIKIGMPIREAFKLKGVKGFACYDPMEETECKYTVGVLCEQINLLDLYYGGCDLLTETANSKASNLDYINDTMNLHANDFKPDAKVACFIVGNK